MDNVLTPVVTEEYSERKRLNNTVDEYMSPPDSLVLNVAYLVDPDFRQVVKNHFPIIGTENEHFYADIAKERLGISFGTEYQFPEGFNARTFQQVFLRCVSLSRGEFSEKERKNLNQSFSILEKLNPEAFKKLDVFHLSEEEKFHIVMGVCSKFTTDDMIHFLKNNRANNEQEPLPGIQFVISEKTKKKLEEFLKEHDTSLAYLTHFEHFAGGVGLAAQEIKMLVSNLKGQEYSVIEEAAKKFREGRAGWQDMPHSDLKILGLMDHDELTIKDEIRQNQNRFFSLLEKSSNPGRFAEQFLSMYSRSESVSQEDRVICGRLSEIKKQKDENFTQRENVFTNDYKCPYLKRDGSR